jgi:hypothetical protein
MVVVESAGVETDVPVTVPMMGLIESDVAFVTFHERVLVPAEATMVGDAEKEEMVGGMLVEVKFAVSVILLFTCTVRGFVLVVMLPVHPEKT